MQQWQIARLPDRIGAIDPLLFRAEKVFDVVFVDNLFLKGKAARTGRLDHAYYLGESCTITCFEGCY